MTPKKAKKKAEKIKEAGYRPSESDIKVAADLVNTGGYLKHPLRP